MNTAFGSVGESQLNRSFRLSLQAAGLKPHTVKNCIHEVERLSLQHISISNFCQSKSRSNHPNPNGVVKNYIANRE